MHTELAVAPRVAATLVVRMARPRLTPVAKAAQRHERRLMRLFLRSVRSAQAAVPMAELEEAVGVPGTGATLFVMQPALDALFEETHLTIQHETYIRAAENRKAVKDVLLDAMKSGAAASRSGIDMKFDATNPEAVRWAEEHAAELVTDVTNGARDAIRAAVTDGVAGGLSRADVAKLVRASIGLTERDASAVISREVDLIERGIDPADAVRRAGRYADKLTRSRARTIARTETMRASNEGQAQLWKQAQDAGLLTGRERKVWITADPCPICAALDGERVGLNEDFSIGSDPPAHPNCRCTVGIVHG